MALLKKTTKETKDVADKMEETKKKAETKKPAKSTSKRGISKKALSVLVRPLVTEKTAQLSDRHVLVFEVASNANRIEVKSAFKELYGVVPSRVNIVNVRGKKVTYGRVEGKRKNWKKAIILLPEGTHVDIFEGI